MSASVASIMQTKQRHQYTRAQPGGFSAHPANAVLLHLRSGETPPSGSLSTYVKILAPGLVTAALWSHVWIGFTPALVIAFLAVVALIAIPRLQRVNGAAPSWANRVSFGERIWLNRLLVPIPPQLGARITTLYLVFWLGVLVALLGGITASAVLALTGLIVAHSAQFVCFRKLVQLFNQMKTGVPLYKFWSAAAGNDNGRA